ncbi:MAG: response regulator [Bdellovibrionales bacterium]|nr:response regulator [Bdellovibrionales bacterium]
MKSLIVEDDFVSRKILQKILSRFGESDVAVDGKEALSAFDLALQENTRYDVICLDINLPFLDGQEVLKAIRARERDLGIHGLECVKVIMTTGRDDTASILTAFREGCEAYVKKPFTREEIVSKLSDLGYE